MLTNNHDLYDGVQEALIVNLLSAAFAGSSKWEHGNKKQAGVTRLRQAEDPFHITILSGGYALKRRDILPGLPDLVSAVTMKGTRMVMGEREEIGRKGTPSASRLTRFVIGYMRRSDSTGVHNKGLPLLRG